VEVTGSALHPRMDDQVVLQWPAKGMRSKPLERVDEAGPQPALLLGKQPSDPAGADSPVKEERFRTARATLAIRTPALRMARLRAISAAGPLAGLSERRQASKRPEVSLAGRSRRRRSRSRALAVERFQQRRRRST
jgi:hypothetical protein